MRTLGISAHRSGLVTSAGLSSAATCAAIRAKVANISASRFAHPDGDWLMAHQVPLDTPAHGIEKLARMAALAIHECLRDIPQATWSGIPLLLCVAEPARPGRIEGLDTRLVAAVHQAVGSRFGTHSAVLPHGRIGAALALARARQLLAETDATQVLLVAADSLLEWETLQAYLAQDRLLGPFSPNGFVAGEGAGAVLVTADGTTCDLVCLGLGFGQEEAHLDSGAPLRGDGLAQAVRMALEQAGLQMHELSYRVTDLSGEQYYFKEAALALLRTMRQRREEFDLWHPAECIGETGALAGIAAMVVAAHASRGGYAPGDRVLLHAGNDTGQRAALVLQDGPAP